MIRVDDWRWRGIGERHFPPKPPVLEAGQSVSSGVSLPGQMFEPEVAPVDRGGQGEEPYLQKTESKIQNATMVYHLPHELRRR